MPKVLEEVDRIRHLPDDILVSILSLLKLREATVAKTLSSRWRRLDSTTTVVSLNSPFTLEHQESRYDVQAAKSFSKLNKNYIKRIHRTLESLEGCRRIARFKIDLPSLWKADYYFPKWLKFALSRETEIIDLRMIYGPDYLNFPLHKIEKKIHSLHGVKYLKELYFSGVSLIDYSGGPLINFISKFDVLERLSIEAPMPAHLGLNGVVGDSVSRLKYLSISKFARVTSIRVSDMLNLVSLKCHGLEPYDIYLHNLPKLADISITNANLDRFGSVLGIPDAICARLERAHVRLDLGPVHGNLGYHVPPFTKLKHTEYFEIKFSCSSNVGSDFRRIDKDRVLKEAEIKELATLKPWEFPWSETELDFLLL